jgi:potassium-dependent mechanosensitive channel
MRYFLLLLLCLVNPVLGQIALPGLGGGTSLADAKSSHSALVSKPPNPFDLSAGWWRYFKVESVELSQHINQSDALLKKLTANESIAIKAQAADLIENLQRYRELRDRADPEPSAALNFQNIYSLRQWLDMARKRQTLQAELQSDTKDLERDEKKLAAARQHMDTMMAAYLELSDHAVGKFSQGLQIMSLWAEQALDTENLRLKKAILAVSNLQLAQLLKEINTARSRIVVSEQDVEQIKKDIHTAEQRQINARENLTQLVAVVDLENLDTAEGNARSLLSKQRINHAIIKEAVADALLSRKRMEYLLMQMLRVEDGNALNGLKTELQGHLDSIKNIKDKLDAWQEKAENDQVRAGKSLASLFVSTEKQNSDVIILTQKRLTEVQNTLLSLQRLNGEINDAKFIADRAESIVTDKQGMLITGLTNLNTSASKVWEWLSDHLEASLFKISETPVTLLGILRVILVITLAWGLSHFVRRGLTHLSERQGGSLTYLYTLGRLAHYLILIIGISIGLSSIGVDLSNFALIAGALSLGVGFGLQAIVSNFVSGLIVLFERSLRIGDFVELSSGLAGEVKAINVRSTLVTTTDMVEILVPNSEFVNGQVINWTLTDASRRIHIPFGVAYGSDKDMVRKAGLEAARNTPHTLKDRTNREPEVWLTNFGDSSLDFELVVWVQPHAVKKPQRVKAAYYWELETALNKYGIEIPFPQRDLHIRSGLPAASVEPEVIGNPALTISNTSKPD